MNVRKPVDYGTMYRELTAILTQNLSQMDEVYAIGKATSQRPEKGAATLNVRRMRDFYKTYENDQTRLRLAMKIGWTLNVVIMEAELTMDARKWYLEQARELRWSKAVLLEKLASAAHLEKPLDAETDTCYTNKEVRKKSAAASVATISSHWLKTHKCFLGNAVDLLCNMARRLLCRSNQRIRYARC